MKLKWMPDTINKKIGLGICSVQALITIIFILSLLALNFLPELYIFLIALALCSLLLLCSYAQYSGIKRSHIGKGISILLSLSLAMMSVYMIHITAAMHQVNGAEVKLDNMVVAVLDTDDAETLWDATTYTFGVDGSENVLWYSTTMVTEINTQLTTTIETIEYDNLSAELLALQNEEINAIIFNEAYLSIIEEQDPDLVENLRIIFEYGIELDLNLNDSLQDTEEEEDVEVEDTEEEEDVIVTESNAFAIYISGIDTYGSITTTSRSDVNIIAVVNPDTEQILLVTTPRDYYVTLPGITGDSADKLTHAGIYGIDVSMNTLGALYDIEFDYYARVNFSSLVGMVNALGGISVYSSSSFWISANGSNYHVLTGYNDLTGAQALAFVRERYAVSGGDFQRGINQQELIKAMIEKITSPAIITGAFELIESVANNVDTNMTVETMQSLIKTQISEGTDWEIIMMDAEGTSGRAYCYSYSGGTLSIVYPNEDSVAEISEALQTILSGELLEN